MRVDNVNVYGLANALYVSGYPMASNLNVYSFTPETAHEKRAEKLANTKIGEGHDNFLNGVVVQFDLTCSVQLWQQVQRYHFLDFISSQSKMHKITQMDIRSSCNKYVLPVVVNLIEDLVCKYNYTDDKHLKQEYFNAIIYNIPSGFEYTASMTTNYRQLKTIYHQRKNHRLEEWKEFCKWVETLPKSYLITGKKEN